MRTDQHANDQNNFDREVNEDTDGRCVQNMSPTCFPRFLSFATSQRNSMTPDDAFCA
jgi:hypothetical protein